MTDNIREFLSVRKQKKYATDTGTQKHLQMQHIFIGPESEKGATDIITKIKQNTGLLMFFGPNSRTEVPIAGKVFGKFVSRRIDRLIIDEQSKTLMFLDYKTDIDKNAFRNRYVSQMNEYLELLKNIYPNYSISGFILWLNDFSLEEIKNL